MKQALLVCAILAASATANAQGNDFPTFPSLPPWAPPPLIVPGGDPALPSLASQEKKAAAANAADRYDAIAQGMDSFAQHDCTLNVFACGYMAYGAPVMRIYSAAARRVQRDPLDPHFREAFDPVLPSAADLGLSYLPDDYPVAGYFNWLVGNAQSTWAWSEMVGVTADRAGTCLWLIEMPNNDCNRGILRWQVDRLNWGISQVGYLAEEQANIMKALRDWLYDNGYAAEGDLYNEAAYTSWRYGDALNQ